jgi:hypothetical protein
MSKFVRDGEALPIGMVGFVRTNEGSPAFVAHYEA